MRHPAVIFLGAFVFWGCKDEAASKPQSAASAAPTNSSIPDDLVVNSFFAQGNVAVAGVDGSAGFGEPGPTAGGDRPQLGA